MDIGENIKQMRIKKGLTQEELAQNLGISQSMIGHIESGRKLPSIPLAVDISKELDCSMNDICREWGVKIMENTICKIFNNSELAH